MLSNNNYKNKNRIRKKFSNNGIYKVIVKLVKSKQYQKCNKNRNTRNKIAIKTN